jgi:thiamine-phosphate pyrophosphorylase
VRGKAELKKIQRVVDANYNRAKEGLRVCEDTARFIFDNKSMTSRFKHLRHGLGDAISAFGLKGIVSAREIVGDVGRMTIHSESRRKGLADIFYANVQRVKESLRVLEEFAKLFDLQAAERLKRLRYNVYDLEKEVLGKMSVISHPRRRGLRL